MWFLTLIKANVDFTVETMLGTLITLVVALIGWGARLEIKVATTAQQHEDLKELINSKFDGMDKRLERIERHVLNGSYGKDHY